MTGPEDIALAAAKSAGETLAKESVSKISTALGGLFPFFGLKHRAIEAYVKDIEDSNMPAESKMMAIANTRKTYKELKNQLAIADIAMKNAKEGTDFSKNSQVDDEWLARFMDSAKFVSDEKVQLVWGKLLASEFEDPNSTPPSLFRILAEITPPYAQIFANLCCLTTTFEYTYKDGSIQKEAFVLFPSSDTYYTAKLRIYYETLIELQTLGLLQYAAAGDFFTHYDTNNKPKTKLIYGMHSAIIINHTDDRLPIGKVLLTKAGLSLSKFVEHTDIQEYFDDIIQYFMSKNIQVDENSYNASN